MRLVDLFEESLIDIEPKDIKIENGKMLPNQFPNKVHNFDCRLKKLTSLENSPQEVNNFICSITAITSLKHSPKIVNGYFYCPLVKITSLEYAPLKCRAFWCYGNDIENLQGIGRKYLKECQGLLIPNTVESNILGLCKIKNLNLLYAKNKESESVTNGPLYEAIEIVKKHLQTDGDECMEELIQNGYKDYAKF